MKEGMFFKQLAMPLATNLFATVQALCAFDTIHLHGLLAPSHFQQVRVMA